MTAAVDLFELEGAYERREVAVACESLWLAALKVYFTDAQGAMRGVLCADPEALDDLTGSRRLLGNLCRPLDIDPAQAGDAFIAALDSGRRFDTAAMNRAIPEQAENYSELNAWRAKHKRKGKPEGITLG